jgi:pimeloyl-ACP methyl ester carboxylesterase
VLGWNQFLVAGHDWGGRAAYIMSALHPDRLIAAASLSIGYSPRGQFVIPSFAQSRRWWYQWLMTVDGGTDAIRKDPIGFARIQWETWSPPGWFDEAEFAAVAESFKNEDWVDITLNGYRSRWKAERLDPRYDTLRNTLTRTEVLSTPMLMVQGGSDACDPPEESEGQDRYFTGGYRRVVLDGIGHFPAREAPEAVSKLLIEHFQRR